MAVTKTKISTPIETADAPVIVSDDTAFATPTPFYQRRKASNKNALYGGIAVAVVVIAGAGIMFATNKTSTQSTTTTTSTSTMPMPVASAPLAPAD